MSRERDRAYLKPAPGAMLPLPSGRRLAVLIVADENHELLEQCLASVTEHLPDAQQRQHVARGARRGADVEGGQRDDRRDSPVADLVDHRRQEDRRSDRS